MKLMEGGKGLWNASVPVPTHILPERPNTGHGPKSILCQGQGRQLACDADRLVRIAALVIGVPAAMEPALKLRRSISHTEERGRSGGDAFAARGQCLDYNDC